MARFYGSTQPNRGQSTGIRKEFVRMCVFVCEGGGRVEIGFDYMIYLFRKIQEQNRGRTDRATDLEVRRL